VNVSLLTLAHFVRLDKARQIQTRNPLSTHLWSFVIANHLKDKLQLAVDRTTKLAALDSETFQAGTHEERTIGAPVANGKAPISVVCQRNNWIEASLAQRSGENPTAIQTADAAVSMWEEVVAALHSVIGRQGVAAMYDRSVSLTARVNPWMAGARGGAKSLVDLAALQAIVAQQDDSTAAAGTAELLRTFYDVLISLIGSDLSDELLRTVRESAVHPVGHEIRNL
jgi:hypothetical protein